MGFTNRTAGTATNAAVVAVNPGGSLSYEITDGLRLFSGVHRGFSPPAPQDAATTRPETSVNYELGGRFTRDARAARAEITAFLSDYDNITSQCTLTAGCTEIDRVFNAGRAHIWGVEAGGGYTLEAGRFEVPLQLAYTYTRSSLRSAFSSADPQLGMVEAGDSLPYIPEHEGSSASASTCKGV